MQLLIILLLLGISTGTSSPVSIPVFKKHSQKPFMSNIQRHMFRSSNHSIPAGGSIWPTAIFWVKVEVGTPPVSFPVAIDSGSIDLDIEGANCDGCPSKAPNGQYDASHSSTSKSVFPYRFSNTYETCDLSDMTAPCTISGGMWSDKVSLGGLDSVEVHFGAITKQTSNFDQFAEICGVMGFIGNGKTNVYAQMVAAGLIDDVWALCLHHGTTSNGTLTIGGTDSRMYHGKISYVPKASGQYYEIDIKGLHIGSTAVTGVKTAILDTGTNVLLTPTTLFNSMEKAFLGMCDKVDLAGICHVTNGTFFDKKCFKLTSAQIQKFPNITFQLDQSVELSISPRDYLLLGDKFAAGSPDLYCLAIRDTGRGGFFIIGNTVMQNYYLVFDRINNQIGWAPVNKDNCGSV